MLCHLLLCLWWYFLHSSKEESAVPWNATPLLGGISILLLSTFYFSFWKFDYDSSWTMMDFFGFILFGVCSLLKPVGLHFLLNSGSFQPWFIQDIISPVLLPFFFWDFNNTNVRSFVIVSQISVSVSFFPLYFYLYCSDWMIPFVIASNLLIVYFVFFILPLNPSFEIFKI